MPAKSVESSNIVRLARAQNGAITTAQLHAVGLSRHAIAARIHRGRLVRLFRAVYAAGDPALMPLVRPAAALLSLGDMAFLSHRSAASIWGLAEDDPSMIDVTVVGGAPRPRPGVRLHRVRHLDSQDTGTHRSLRLTSPARALIDFASQANSAELLGAFGDARANGLLTDRALNESLKRAPQNHRGAAIVRGLWDEGGTYDRSRAETIIRNLCRKAELQQPLVNARVEGFRADFLWPDVKLILEVDGHRSHGGRMAFEADRKRDQVHVAAGYAVIRVTWRQLQNEPLAVLARLAQAMARRAA